MNSEPRTAAPLHTYHVCCRCHKLRHESELRRYRIPGRLHDYRWICKAHLQATAARRPAPAVRRPSPLELEVIQALTRSKLPWQREHKLRRHRVDFYVPKLALVIEADGRKYHGPERQLRDKLKRDALRQWGYGVAVIKAHDVAGQVQAALAVREAEVAAWRAEYARRVEELRHQIETNPSMLLPRARDFRLRRADYDALQQLRQQLLPAYEAKQARQIAQYQQRPHTAAAEFATLHPVPAADHDDRRSRYSFWTAADREWAAQAVAMLEKMP